MAKIPKRLREQLQLKQKIDDWQSAETITIAGISHTVGEGNTENWEGIPGANGTCEISLNDDNSVKFKWSGGNESGGKKYPFDMDEDLMGPLIDSGLLTTDNGIMNAYNFEIDSKADTQRVKQIENEIAKKENSLLKYGTWAYYGNGNGKFPSSRYLFWTSFRHQYSRCKQKNPCYHPHNRWQILCFRNNNCYSLQKNLCDNPCNCRHAKRLQKISFFRSKILYFRRPLTMHMKSYLPKVNMWNIRILCRNHKKLPAQTRNKIFPAGQGISFFTEYVSFL